MQIAFGAIDPRRVNKPVTGHFAKAGVTPRRHLVELRTSDASEYTLGQELAVDTFEVGQTIDVVGTTKGKGYAGVMKRHGFSGVGASHGAQPSTASRAPSAAARPPAVSSRACAWRAAWAATRHTTQNLTIHAIDAENGMILIKGAVPGPKGGLVFVRTSAKEA